MIMESSSSFVLPDSSFNGFLKNINNNIGRHEIEGYDILLNSFDDLERSFSDLSSSDSN